MRKKIILLFVVTISLSFTTARAETKIPLSMLQLPPGFKVELYAIGLPNARSLARGAKGTIFVGTRTAGSVYALVDQDQDQRADQVYTIARGLRSPNGVAFKDGALYVAEISRIWRFDNIEDNLSAVPKPVLITDQLPDNGWHGWKFIAFGPDGKLYVPIGAPCNVCESPDERFAAIHTLDVRSKALKLFASGVRNTVGFDWHPQTRNLWFTDNGRDGLGDNVPPDELNRAPRPGYHFGFPYCHGRDLEDPEFGAEYECKNFTPPAQELDAHAASLGMRFYTGAMFPEEYKNQIFIAEHGSWDRSTKIGYRVSLVRLQGNKAVSYETFASGWEVGEKAWGRPVDVLVMPDGALLVSDDLRGVVYRISYQAS